jgi:uncharacterized membrane protein YfcA
MDSSEVQDVLRRLLTVAANLTIANDGDTYTMLDNTTYDMEFGAAPSNPMTSSFSQTIVDDGQQSSSSYAYPTLFPLSNTDIAGFILASMGLIVAAGGGIGGGGMLVPIYIMVMKFSPKHAVALSNVTVFGGAVANTLLNSRKRHPKVDRPLIDWNMLLIMEPLTIVGALVGAFLNKMLPELVLVILLVVLLSFTARSTLKKARKMYLEESQASEEGLLVNVSDDVQIQRYDDENDLVLIAEEINRNRDMFVIECDDSDDSEAGENNVTSKSEQSPCHFKNRANQKQATSVFLENPQEPYVYVSPEVSPACATSKSVSHLHDIEMTKQRLWPSSSSPRTGTGHKNKLMSDDDRNDAAVIYGGMGKELDEENVVSNEVLYVNKNHNESTITSADDEPPSSLNTNDTAMLEHIIESERRVPLKSIAIICTMFVGVLIMNILKGGGAFTSPLGVECGSALFWLSEILIVSWVWAIFAFARRFLLRKTHLKQQLRYKYTKGDIVWDERATWRYPSICAVAGCFAGMFGVGGGIVKGPLMLHMNVLPGVASATSACMILFTSFTATTSYAVFGLLIQDYALAGMTVGFVSTLVGQTLMSWLIRLYDNRSSFIAYSIGIAVLLSALFMTIESLSSLFSATDREARMHPSGICSTVQ